MKMRKGLLFMFVAIMVFTLAACSGNGAPTPPNTGNNQSNTPDNATPAPENDGADDPVVQDKEPVTLTVGTFGDDAEKAAMNGWFDEYKKTHPYVTFKLIALEGNPAATAVTMAAAGNMPDVIWVYDGYVKTMYEQGLLAPLDEGFQRLGVDMNDIPEGMMSYGHIEGKYYFAPRDHSQLMVVVNKTLLEQEGIPMPQNGWSWDEFVDTVKATTKKDESGQTTQFGVRLNLAWLPSIESYALGRGGEYLNKETLQVSFSDPKVVAGLKDAADLIKEGYADNPWVTYPEDFWATGKMAMAIHVRPGIPTWANAAKAKGFEWDVVSFPKLPEREAIGSGTSGYAANAASKVKDEAVDFVASLMLPAEHKAFGVAGGTAVPILKSLQSDDYWRKGIVEGKNTDAFVYNVDKTVGRDTDVLLKAEAGQKVESEISEALKKYVTNETSLEDALKKADEVINGTQGK
ncbi:ABC transporter substrate-binding protein [Paenibacillus nasutitermitis]|uniref:Sugar ABC transporter substrate-binding protein n=1 Tax=Paenibacillus nasutitermitis TaxID=1652958 RepID=A0A916YLA1_9BACL|nr:extracellular solute-binding protein [Paenibacillus nasutitermitis]GGD51230.1 sugar ABC transporter substrate-binding protein [Paenibacillus nasutitermitis]